VEEVALASEVHADASSLRRSDYLGIANRAARLNYRLYAAANQDLKAIGKREECIASGNRTLGASTRALNC
jgi:hypothetical protein